MGGSSAMDSLAPGALTTMKEDSFIMKNICIAAACILPLLSLISGCYTRNRPLPYGGHMMDSWCGGGFMWILLVVLIGLVIYLLVRLSKPEKHGESPSETPLDILKARYAKGEITKDEYESMKEDLAE